MIDVVEYFRQKCELFVFAKNEKSSTNIWVSTVVINRFDLIILSNTNVLSSQHSNRVEWLCFMMNLDKIEISVTIFATKMIKFD